MALRYTTEDLLCLRDSPLCVKPENLPPTDEWMGQSPEQPARHQQQNSRGQVGAFDKFRNNVENPLHDQTNRRPVIDRHVSRASATNPEDIVFGPPRMAFASSGRATKPTDGDKLKEGDAQGRFGFRSRNEGEGDRLSANRATNPLRRRGDGTDQDSDGWTPVKPRKSFGAENAERFQGRMGGNFRDEKVQSKDPNGRTARPFDTFSRERSMKEESSQPKGTTDKNGTETWHKSKNSEGRLPEKRERIDRAKNWRERDQESEIQDQGNARNADRRWGGDRRVEREPEWLDEPADLKGEARTQQDFQKWMEDMKKTKTGQPPSNESSAIPHEHSFEEPPASAPIITEQGPDKFFMAFGSKNSTEVSSPGDQPEVAASRPKPAGKSSRFTSFFQNHEVKTEPPTPMAAPPPPPMGLNLFQQPQPSALGPLTPAAPQDEEKQAFQQLLAKLQKHSMSATPPGPSPFMVPGQPNPAMEAAKKAQMPASPFEALLGGAGRPPPQQPHEIHAPRPQPQTARPEQLLQDLVGHHQRVSSRGSGRPDEGAARNNSNTEFLMNLMRAGSGSTESQLHKQAPPPKGGEREIDFGRDVRALPRQVRPPPPPGFPLEEGEYMPNPPTILQRPPPPPGLDQMPPNWMGGGGVQLPPLQPPQQQQQRGPMLPPPGLAGGPGRNPPMPPMFPPNFPPGAMPMPEGMGNMPPRNMGPPPLGFFGQMPPGFMPHGMGGFDGPPGPQSPGGFGPQAPYENRGMPAPGGRGNNFGRG